jgi:hypothetical protein
LCIIYTPQQKDNIKVIVMSDEDKYQYGVPPKKRPIPIPTPKK